MFRHKQSNAEATGPQRSGYTKGKQYHQSIIIPNYHRIMSHSQILDVKPIFKKEPLTVATPAKRGRKRKTEDPALAAPSTSAKSTTMNIALDAVKNEPFNWRKKLRLQHQQLAPSKTEV